MPSKPPVRLITCKFFDGFKTFPFVGHKKAFVYMGNGWDVVAAHALDWRFKVQKAFFLQKTRIFLNSSWLAVQGPRVAYKPVHMQRFLHRSPVSDSLHD
jgi:hypothetical protein